MKNDIKIKSTNSTTCVQNTKKPKDLKPDEKVIMTNVTNNIAHLQVPPNPVWASIVPPTLTNMLVTFARGHVVISI